jgi:hypothetical protein
MYNLTEHAKRRVQQRGLSKSAIRYIINHSKPYHRAGVIFYYLRDRDIPRPDQKVETLSKLAGTAVVASKDKQNIVTVWRNRQNGLKLIKCKPVYCANL